MDKGYGTARPEIKQARAPRATDRHRKQSGRSKSRGSSTSRKRSKSRPRDKASRVERLDGIVADVNKAANRRSSQRTRKKGRRKESTELLENAPRRGKERTGRRGRSGSRRRGKSRRRSPSPTSFLDQDLSSMASSIYESASSFASDMAIQFNWSSTPAVPDGRKGRKKQRNDPLAAVLGLAMVAVAVVSVGSSAMSAMAAHHGSSSSSGGHSTKTFNPKPGSKPNVIIFFPDDMGYNDVGYTNPGITKPFSTPNMNYLSSNSGVRFTRYYTVPNCAPARCALMTGRYTNRYGCQHKDPDYEPYGVPLDEPFLSRVLKNAGYYNVMLGKWHLGMFMPSYTPMQRGFDEFIGFLGGGVGHFDHEGDDEGFDWWNGESVDKSTKGIHSTAVINSSMVDFLSNRAYDLQPFFVYVPVLGPHGPLEAPRQWTKQLKGILDDTTSEEAHWAAMVLMLDSLIGTTVSTLKANDMYHNTMIIYAGDHGSEQYDPDYDGSVGRCYPFSGEKGQLWEGGAHVPGWMHAPFMHADVAGQEITTPVAVYDWFATIAGLAGADMSSEYTLDGTDLSSWLFQGGSAPTNRQILLSLDDRCGDDDDWDKPNAGMVYGPYKLLVDCISSDGEVMGDVQLFNVVNDQTESTDLADNGDYADLITTMLTTMSYLGTQSVTGFDDEAPYGDDDYFCANCVQGCPTNGVWKPYYDNYLNYIGGDCD